MTEEQINKYLTDQEAFKCALGDHSNHLCQYNEEPEQEE